MVSRNTQKFNASLRNDRLFRESSGLSSPFKIILPGLTSKNSFHKTLEYSVIMADIRSNKINSKALLNKRLEPIRNYSSMPISDRVYSRLTSLLEKNANNFLALREISALYFMSKKTPVPRYNEQGDVVGVYSKPISDNF